MFPLLVRRMAMLHPSLPHLEIETRQGMRRVRLEAFLRGFSFRLTGRRDACVNTSEATTGLNPHAPATSSSGSDTENETEHSHNKSVMFAPLSPTSSRRLSRSHQAREDDSQPASSTTPLDPASTFARSRPEDAHFFDDNGGTNDASSPAPRRRRRRRRNSDPLDNRPTNPTRRRHRPRNPTRSPSPDSSDATEVLPDRFDDNGRPLDRERGFGGGGGAQGDMVEKLAHDFLDVMDGRKGWKDILGEFVKGAQRGGGGRRRSSRR
ncbi:hypothetical protein BJ875DRAFT_48530 [Amylocarpus encephaloides]|uniref:Uncharacterized protein n=1 Tax=Amylocarpus encephaloides TaxID=45428 RepID=A0A9P7YRH8_9HELO|nr:hypothetical protein BJ875DRAFT_48530 [Amylocarpus encephaloides]